MKNRSGRLLALGIAIVATGSHAAETSEAALEAHMSAINTLETDRIVSTQHFPFTHLWPDGRSDHQPTAADFEPIDPAVLGSEWHHSVLDDAEEIARTETSVTYLIAFSRHREDDSRIGRYRAIWIATQVGGDWRVQFRHGALPID